MILVWLLDICNSKKVSKNSKDLHIHFCSLSLNRYISKGSCNNYIDRFLAFFDHLPTSCRQFIYWGLFTCVDIWLTIHPPCLVYIVVACPPLHLKPLCRPGADDVFGCFDVHFSLFFVFLWRLFGKYWLKTKQNNQKRCRLLASPMVGEGVNRNQ